MMISHLKEEYAFNSALYPANIAITEVHLDNQNDFDKRIKGTTDFIERWIACLGCT